MGTLHCRSNSFHTTGKRWVEVYVDELVGNRNLGVGVSTIEIDITKESIGRVQVGNLPISSGNQVGINRDGNLFSKTSILYSEGPVIEGTTISVGDVLNLAIDLDTGLVGFYVNGDFKGEISIPTGDPYYVTLGVEKGCQMTVNLFQDLIYTYAPPAGYTDWDGNGIGGPNPPSNNLSIGVY